MTIALIDNIRNMHIIAVINHNVRNATHYALIVRLGQTTALDVVWTKDTLFTIQQATHAHVTLPMNIMRQLQSANQKQYALRIIAELDIIAVVNHNVRNAIHYALIVRLSQTTALDALENTLFTIQQATHAHVRVTMNIMRPPKSVN